MMDKQKDVDTINEIIDFGPNGGKKQIRQANGSSYMNACLQINSRESDNTGYRIHPGCHVSTRFVLKYPHFIKDKAVCELGAGTGVFSLISTNGGTICTSLCITDGNSLTVDIAANNVLHLIDSSKLNKITCKKLSWGCKRSADELIESLSKSSALFTTTATSNIPIEIHQEKELQQNDTNNIVINNEKNIKKKLENGLLLNENKSAKPFDVIIGCELLYYRTNVEELLSTVLYLTNSSKSTNNKKRNIIRTDNSNGCKSIDKTENTNYNSGLFIHSHIFRRIGQDRELINYLAEYNWITVEIPICGFVDKNEIDEHPEWYNVHCLISGPKARIYSILAEANLDIENRYNNTRDNNDNNRDINNSSNSSIGNMSNNSYSSSSTMNIDCQSALLIDSERNKNIAVSALKWKIFDGFSTDRDDNDSSTSSMTNNTKNENSRNITKGNDDYSNSISSTSVDRGEEEDSLSIASLFTKKIQVA